MGEQHQAINWKTLDEHTQNTPEIPLNLISLQALIDMLVAKGIVTPEELSQAEMEHRQKVQQQLWHENPTGAEKRSVNYSYYSITTRSGRSSKSGQLRWLKRKMSKRRWTRRLGTFLFGWKWKKMSKETKNHVPLEN